MSDEILINVTPSETRVALVEGGLLQELHLERASHNSYVGNIYKGRVERILPGMQAAFINVGLERTAFLHAADILPSRTDLDDDGGDNGEPPEIPGISELLRDGQEIVVQVIKDPMGTKGARLTTQLSVPSRYVVLLPRSSNIGVSVRIEDDDERTRLKKTLESLLPGDTNFGYILRTNAEGVDQAPLGRDIVYLERLWRRISRRAEEAQPGACIYADLSLPLRALRDLMNASVEKVRIDHPGTLAQTLQFADEFIPDWRDRLELYEGEGPLFDLYGVEDEIQRALQRSTSLKSGGYIIIDQTEAMTTVDVNTGGYVGHRNLEETIYKTNLEAAQSIARQLRLRNLGGIIIIDFIDMVDEDHKRQVLRTLERALERGHARTTVSQISDLGLVEMTRKRTTDSLEHLLCEPCADCQGRGKIKTVETVCFEIFREILRAVRQFETGNLLVLAAPAVVDKILDELSRTVAELEEMVGKSIRFQAEEEYGQEQFDVVLL